MLRDFLTEQGRRIAAENAGMNTETALVSAKAELETLRAEHQKEFQSQLTRSAELVQTYNERLNELIKANTQLHADLNIGRDSAFKLIALNQKYKDLTAKVLEGIQTLNRIEAPKQTDSCTEIRRWNEVIFAINGIVS